MKKLMLIIASLFGIATALSADNDRAITKEQLPEKAKAFITEYFPNEKIAFAKEERDFLELEYEVAFTNGAKLKFRRNGDWKEVDCKFNAVPEGIVPVQILSKVNELYPQAAVVCIERDKRSYEAKLNNRLELKFDLAFNLIDIDD